MVNTLLTIYSQCSNKINNYVQTANPYRFSAAYMPKRTSLCRNIGMLQRNGKCLGLPEIFTRFCPVKKQEKTLLLFRCIQALEIILVLTGVLTRIFAGYKIFTPDCKLFNLQFRSIITFFHVNIPPSIKIALWLNPNCYRYRCMQCTEPRSIPCYRSRAGFLSHTCRCI